MEIEQSIEISDFNYSEQRRLNKRLKKAVSVSYQLKVEYDRYIKNFKEWSNYRKKSIQSINSLRQKLDDAHFGSNVGRCTGASVGIAGGIFRIAGACLAPSKASTSSILSLTGMLLGIAGSMTEVLSEGAKMAISKEVTNEVKIILERDEELAQPIKNWIRLSNKLDGSLSKIFNCGLLSNTLENIMNLFIECKRLFTTGCSTIEDMMKDIKNSKNKNYYNLQSLIEEGGGKILQTIQCIHQNEELNESMINIYKIFQESPILFEFSKLGMKIYFDILSSRNMDILHSAKIHLGIKSHPTDVGSAITTGIFEAIKITSDVVTIISAAKELQENKKNEYSETLFTLKVALELEMQKATEMHDTIMKSLQAKN